MEKVQETINNTLKNKWSKIRLCHEML